MIKGIDVSEWQSGLSLKKAKDSGYNFAILRAGYTGYGSSRNKVVDEDFEAFYAEAKKDNLPVGAYWYSCADSAEQGKLEAEFMYENCLRDKQFEYPIYLDVEEEKWQGDNKKGVTDAIIAFCDYLEDKGYYVGVYASLYWFDAKIDTARLSAYTKWVATWSSTKPSFDYNAFDMWQYTDDVHVDGWKIDANECYVDFPKVIKEGGFNGYGKDSTLSPEPTPTPQPTKEVKASQPAYSYNEYLDGAYIVNAEAGLNIRDGASTDYKVLVSIPYGTKVNNYGYYTYADGIRWMYVTFVFNGVRYTGFASGEWLTKL